MSFSYKKLVLTLASVLIIASSFNSVIAAKNPNLPKPDEIPMDTGAVFEDSTIMGTVYVDRNQNGIQDEGEEGVGGVRLLTAMGKIITTDQQGRYSLAGISGGISGRGSNLIIKLDKDSLPSQYKLIGRQSETVRLSSGLPQKIDFRVIEKQAE